MAGIENKCNNWMCEDLPPGKCGLEMQAENQVDRNATRAGFQWKRHCWKDYKRFVLDTAKRDNCQYLDRLKQILEEIEPDFDDATPSEPEESQAPPESPAQKY